MKREKVLRSYTIIPQELYVNRSADAHLKRIVDDMGRPGYVLVARQMGKTNLLLNAKRTLGGGIDRFVYLDVSNPFPTIRSFLRNIVDIAIDSYADELRVAESTIKAIRASSEEIPPHKEHENELREILRATKGRLVICLDEIDALTKTSYADLVFSLIRSIYFSGRVNISEFVRLTYVLSGVAEPAELIRNKDVSPFNIGEKIFLDDFSRLEFEQFIQKANLPFEKEIIDGIFQWANGNPRMSWDICSALEDVMIQEGNLSVDSVNNTVQRLYLTDFDRPPIDHIRTLVEDDGSVRDALIAIHYGKSESIPDAVKNRLYLAGITRPSHGGEGGVSIRNKILQESLSEKWIREVERKLISVFDLAEKSFKKGFYDDALALYFETLEGSTNTMDQGLTYYRIGSCQFNLARYSDAIVNLSKTSFGKGSVESVFYTIEHMLGLSYHFTGDSAGSVEHFKKVMEQDIDGDAPLFLYFDACVNLSAALLSLPDFEKVSDEIIKLCELVIKSESLVKKPQHSNYSDSTILCLANYNLAIVSRRQGQLDFAQKYFNTAINLADANAQLALLVEAIGITEDHDRKVELLESCVKIVCDNKLETGTSNRLLPLCYTDEVCVRLIEYLQENNCHEALDRLVAHLSDKSMSHSSGADELVGKAVMGLVTRGNRKATLALIRRALGLSVVEKGSDVRRLLMTIGVLLTPTTDTERLGNEYVNEYIQCVGSRLVATDFRVIWELVRREISIANFDTAEEIVKKSIFLCAEMASKSGGDLTEKQIESGELVLGVLELDVLHAKGMVADVRGKIEPLLTRLDAATILSLPYFEEKFLHYLRKRARQILEEVRAIATIRRAEKKIGRNELIKVRFLDGRIESGKFKKYQASLISGKCIVVEGD